MHPIDVHILTMPDSNREWLSRCIKSLDGEPVNLHILPGVKGDIAAGRMAGFAMGSAPYVSWVDHDDAVMPGIFSDIIWQIGNQSRIRVECQCAIYTDEVIIGEKTFISGWSTNPEPFRHDPRLKLCRVPGTSDSYMHHLLVLPRYSIADCPKPGWLMAPEPEIIAHAASRGVTFHHLKQVGYMWRQHSDNASNKL